MASEENKQPTPIDPANPPEPIQEIAGRDRPRNSATFPLKRCRQSKLDEVADAVKQDEPVEAREARREGEAVLNKPIEAIEDSVNAVDMEDQAKIEHALPHVVADTTTMFGMTFHYPIYTVVYVVLAAITLIELVIGSLPRGILATAILLALSISKAVLVVLFYMHLKEDSRIFAFALILPIFIALVSSLFLLTVPIKGY